MAERDNLSKEQKVIYITEALDNLAPDIISLLYRIVAAAESGLEQEDSMSDLELKIINKILTDEEAMFKALAFILQDQGSAPGPSASQPAYSAQTR